MRVDASVKVIKSGGDHIFVNIPLTFSQVDASRWTPLWFLSFAFMPRGRKRKRVTTSTGHLDAFAVGGIAALEREGYSQSEIAASGAVLILCAPPHVLPFHIRLLRGGCGASGRDARLVDSLVFPPTSRDLSALFVVFQRENARAAALDSLTRDFLVKRKGRYFFYCRPTSRQVGALRACWLMLPGMVRERHRRRCCSRGHLNGAGGAGAVVFRTGP